MTEGTLFNRTRKRIEEYLAEHPHVSIEKEDGWLWVRRNEPTGYDVGLSDEGDEVILYAGNYHEHLNDDEEAAAAFIWMLTPSYRVVATFRGSSCVKAVLQRIDGESMVDLGTFGLLFPLFGKKRVEVFQNRLIEPSEV